MDDVSRSPIEASGSSIRGLFLAPGLRSFRCAVISGFDVPISLGACAVREKRGRIRY